MFWWHLLCSNGTDHNVAGKMHIYCFQLVRLQNFRGALTPSQKNILIHKHVILLWLTRRMCLMMNCIDRRNRVKVNGAAVIPKVMFTQHPRFVFARYLYSLKLSVPFDIPTENPLS